MSEDLAKHKNVEFLSKLEKLRAGTFDTFSPPGFKGTLLPFQKNNVLSLSALSGQCLTDATGLGKTVSTIALCGFLRSRGFKGRFIVVTIPSSAKQWAKEFEKFSDLRVEYVTNASDDHRKASVGKKQRLKSYESFFSGDSDALILTYFNLLHDGIRAPEGVRRRDTKKRYLGEFFEYLGDAEYMVVFDEAQSLKTLTSQTHKICKVLANRAVYKYALTATPIMNNLYDLFGISSVLTPDLIGDVRLFEENFCVFEEKQVLAYRPKKKLTPSEYKKAPKRRIRVHTGYKNLDEFREMVRPFYYGHRKTEVEDQLPKLIQKIVSVDLTPTQRKVYRLIKEEAIEELSRGLEDGSKVSLNNLNKLAFLQQAVNSLEVLPDDLGSGHTDSAKIDEVIRIIQEELSGDKVVVFSKFRKIIDILQRRMNDLGIKTARITGAEGGEEKYESQSVFREDPSVQVCLITSAGSASVNLQVAQYLICMDLPWSVGAFVQLVGRIHRLGSTHKSVVAMFLLAESTIDTYMWGVLTEKMDLSDFIMGGSDVVVEDADIIKPSDLSRYLSQS